MTASASEMDELSRRLWEKGIAAFCPTTFSAEPKLLLAAVERMGRWISSFPKKAKYVAIPLGIHLEGPFLSAKAAGAHSPRAIRPLNMPELDRLWKVGQGTLKILTVAPEGLSPRQLTTLRNWARTRKIVLSLGHSRATQAQAETAFDLGFQGVTHSWNALSFHQREPGVLGAAFERPDVHVELIADQVHVHPTLIRWTLELHRGRVCFVSDCAPAAGVPGKEATFGSLKIRNREGACRLPDGSLAGGGKLLSEAYVDWLNSEAKSRGLNIADLLALTLPLVTENPLKVLGVRLPPRWLEWKFTQRKIVEYRAT